LFQPHLGITAVQLARYSAMSGGISKVIRVQEKEFRPADEHLPATQPDHRTRELNLNTQPLSICTPKRLNGHLPWIVHRIECALIAISIEVLAKVSLSPQ
jgi:hypothetical protein